MQQGGLARPVGTDDGDEAAGRHGEGGVRPDEPAAAYRADVGERQRGRRAGQAQTATPRAFANAVSWAHCQPLKRGLPGRYGLGDVDDRHPGLFGGRTDLLGDRTLGLGVVDQDVDLPAGQRGAECVDVARRRI